MEFEKTLFRVHERLLLDQTVRKIVKILMYFFLVTGILGTTTLFFANILYEGKPTCLAFMEFIIDENLTQSTYYQYNIEGSSLYLIASSTKELISLNDTIKQTHNFTQLNRTIPRSCYFHNHVSELVFVFSLGYENLLINDLVSSYPDKLDLFLRNNQTNEMWSWSKSTLSKYRIKISLMSRLMIGILEMCKITLGLFIQSAIATLYIKITIICAPIFILLILECLVNFGNREVQPGLLNRAFPWIGAYIQVLDFNNRRSKSHLLLAFFLMLMLFYFIYLSTVFIGTFLLFYKSIPNGIDENFFAFLAIVEFCTSLFFRTRATIFYAPKFILIQYFIFFFYISYSLYGFFYLAFYCLIYWIIFTISFFICYLEIPALSWNPQSPYTPTLDRPRCYYLPLFHFGWVNDIPHIWTMFYPLHGRRFFNLNNLSLVDRNFVLLNNIMRQEQNNEAEMIEIQNPQPLHPQLPLQPPQPVGDQNQHLNQNENEAQHQPQHELIQFENVQQKNEND